MAKKRKVSIEILTPAMAESGLIEEVSMADPAEMKLEEGDRVVVRLFRLGKDHEEEEHLDDGTFPLQWTLWCDPRSITNLQRPTVPS
jgi:hypothetical protein